MHRRIGTLRIALAALLIIGGFAGPAAAQSVGVSDSPCKQVPAAPAAVAAELAARQAAGAAGHTIAPPSPATLQAYNAWRAAVRERDFFDLCRYRAENAALPPAGWHRIVFFGDSITELWQRNAPDLFRGDTLNRGISGQTTQQLLGRFRADVIDLKPASVHIMAGTNDIAGNTGPTSLAWIEANISSMVELAQAHRIRVILATIPPAAKFGWRPEIAPAPTIIAYNRWLRRFAAQRRLALVDYHAVLDDGHSGFIGALASDGVHPNARGYRVMTARLLPVLAKAGF